MKENRIPDLFIEKLLLDELPKRKKEELLKDPMVQRRITELKAANQKILDEYPPGEMARAIQRRARRGEAPQAEVERTRSAGDKGGILNWLRGERPSSAADRRGTFGWPRLVPVAGFALVVLVGGLLLITRGPSVFAPRGPAEEVRLKGGGAYLTVYKQTATGAQALESGDAVAERNNLQIGYVAGTNRYGAILSIDGRGTVTLHYPVSAAADPSLEAGGEVLLPFSYALDDAPDFERFFFVVSEKPFSVNEVLEAARDFSGQPQKAKKQNLNLPKGLEQTSILLLK
jgi:hypothetical protein